MSVTSSIRCPGCGLSVELAFTFTRDKGTGAWVAVVSKEQITEHLSSEHGTAPSPKQVAR